MILMKDSVEKVRLCYLLKTMKDEVISLQEKEKAESLYQKIEECFRIINETEKP